MAYNVFLEGWLMSNTESFVYLHILTNINALRRTTQVKLHGDTRTERLELHRIAALVRSIFIGVLTVLCLPGRFFFKSELIASKFSWHVLMVLNHYVGY